METYDRREEGKIHMHKTKRSCHDLVGSHVERQGKEGKRLDLRLKQDKENVAQKISTSGLWLDPFPQILEFEAEPIYCGRTHE